MKKKVTAIICAVVVLVGGIAAAWYFLYGKSAALDGSEVYVESVASLMGYSDLPDASTPFGGVVESQETVGVSFDSSKKLLECLVTENSEVKAGDPLFSYDMTEQTLQLEQLKLERQRIANSIDDLNAQLTALKKEKESAPAEEQLSYTTQIQTLQSSIKQEQYNKEVKQLEISRAESALENNTVKAPIDGIIYKIDSSKASGGGTLEPMFSDGGGSEAYITIMALGNYRIKGYINEQNIGSLRENDEVTIRSRVDQSQTWKGVVSVIDRSNPSSQSSGGAVAVSSSDESVNTSSKYPFYVSLTSYEGLMLGQHVYIEYGVVPEERDDTIRLSGGYIVQEDGSAYVWADKDGRIEKRYVKLGEYDEQTDSYEIKDGLALEDRIAWADDTIEEGMRTVSYEDMESETIDGEPGGSGLIGGDLEPDEVVGGSTDDVPPEDAAPADGGAAVTGGDAE